MAKIEFEVECEGHALCAFDTAALPSDFDTLVGNDPIALHESLQDDGRIWHDVQGTEGSYICHVYVDEPLNLDPDLKSRILSWSEPTLLDCPSGELWICGGNYAALEPRKGNTATPKGGLRYHKRGKRIKVRKGLHSLCIIRVDKDEDDMSFLAQFSWIDVVFFSLGLLIFIFSMASFVFGLQFLIGLAGAGIESVAGKDFCDCRPLRISLWQQLAIMLASVGATGLLVSAFNSLGRLDVVKTRYQREKKKRLSKPDYIFDIKTARFLGVNPKAKIG
jgi:hypothetical protein